MARRISNDDIPEVPVPIAAIVAKVGYTDDIIWQRLKAGEVFQDWNGEWSVRRSTAKRVHDEISGATTAADAENARKIAEQQDREAWERSWPTSAYELARQSTERRVPGGVQAFGPDDETPGWGLEGDE